ncbi:hypothetical protein [Microbispora sp. CA-102843]|uniref:hypothetical protein n=1 Tax=Microbispora sp. CA-102843 TaxID=3239952 RepID=UPI003D8B7938
MSRGLGGGPGEVPYGCGHRAQLVELGAADVAQLGELVVARAAQVADREQALRIRLWYVRVDSGSASTQMPSGQVESCSRCAIGAPGEVTGQGRDLLGWQRPASAGTVSAPPRPTGTISAATSHTLVCAPTVSSATSPATFAEARFTTATSAVIGMNIRPACSADCPRSCCRYRLKMNTPP